MEHRRNSIGKTLSDSGEKSFVADIGFPGDLPLPTHEGLLHRGSIDRQKSVEASLAEGITHDKIARHGDQLKNPGLVEGAHKMDNLQALHTGPSSLKTDIIDLEIDNFLEPILELPEKKGLVTRAVESVAAAAGTVAGIFSSSTHKSDESECQLDSQTAIPVEEKGLVDSAIEKVWNALTGKDEQPAQKPTQPDIQTIQAEIVEHSNLNADAPVFVPHGVIP